MVLYGLGRCGEHSWLTFYLYIAHPQNQLDYFPATLPGHAQLIAYLQGLAPALAASADPNTGVWWLVMQEGGRSGNYFESSGASMFVYSILKGIRKGYLDKQTFFPVAQKAYNYITDTFVKTAANGTANWEGTVVVGSLSGNATFEVCLKKEKR